MAATALILLATWGGTEYAWASAQIIGLGLIAVASLAGFLLTETRAAEPILPLHVFKNRNFSVTMALTFLVGLAMFGAMTFLPLFQQTVQGESPTISGLALTPMMVGVTITSILAGQVTTRTGQYKIFPVVGGAIMALGMFLLTHLDIGTTRVTSALYYVVLGLGMGFLMQMVSLIAQNSVSRRTWAWPAAAGCSSSRSAARSGWPRSARCSPGSSPSRWPARPARGCTSAPAAASSTRRRSTRCPP